MITHDLVVSTASGTQASDFAHRFSTKPIDVPTGLYYYGYRYYDAATGRWPLRDLIEELGGINLVLFLSNNPLSKIDVLGTVDMNFFPPDEEIVKRADKAANGSPYLTIAGHGTQFRFGGKDGMLFSAEQLAEKIRAHPKFERVKAIFLMSCDTGKLSHIAQNNFAQQLADKLNKIVIAPDTLIWFEENGNSILAPEKPKKGDSDTGNYHNFFPSCE